MIFLLKYCYPSTHKITKYYVNWVKLNTNGANFFSLKKKSSIEATKILFFNLQVVIDIYRTWYSNYLKIKYLFKFECSKHVAISLYIVLLYAFINKNFV